MSSMKDLLGDQPYEYRPSPAKAARDEAIDRVATNAGSEWVATGLNKISQLAAGEYTGEQIRLILTEAGIVPHHHNAWGALISSAVKRGILIDTGRLDHMQTKKSHARKTSVYQKAA